MNQLLWWGATTHSVEIRDGPGMALVVGEGPVPQASFVGTRGS